MALLKCKMCGGDLELTNDSTICVCEYCGTKQTVPIANDEKKINLFSRANRLRLDCEYDKAYAIYESIVEEYPKEAEAYWGLVLCKFGIEYVDDPKTSKKIPTCHRSSFNSILDDADFESALKYADAVSRALYQDEAESIEELRRGIIEISSKEEPYDIFICYKETDANGERTIDSVIAQDVYEALTKKKYRVFFARITLESKLGREYEPYIFSALHSSSVMLVFGTDYDYFNAVWVKNEWSRFLELIENGEDKYLIPCYKDIGAYDMPKEFNKLQAQDMGKVGAIQDLVRGIEKIIMPREEENALIIQQANLPNGAVAPLLKRANIFLDNGDFKKADECFEKALDIDPENEEALLGKLLAEYKASNIEELSRASEPFDKSENYAYLIKVCSDETRQKLQKALENATALNKSKAEKRRKNAIISIAISAFAIIVIVVALIINYALGLDKNPNDDITESNNDSSDVMNENALPNFISPLAGRISLDYSEIVIFSQTMNDYRTHLGVDIGAALGTEILAVADGTVTDVWSDPFMGTCISIEHSENVISIYKNLAPTVKAGIVKGAIVNSGDVIAYVGESAMNEIAEVPHLHYELKIDGENVDPKPYIGFSNSNNEINIDEITLPTFILPVDGKISLDFSDTTLIFSQTMKDYRTHLGVDIGADLGTEVLAVADGIVTNVWVDPFMGTCISIQHSGKAISIYKNLDPTIKDGIVTGSAVNSGDVIAYIGKSANNERAEVPHLHYELKINDKHVDPKLYLTFSNEEK